MILWFMLRRKIFEINERNKSKWRMKNDNQRECKWSSEVCTREYVNWWQWINIKAAEGTNEDAASRIRPCTYIPILSRGEYHYRTAKGTKKIDLSFHYSYSEDTILFYYDK